MTALDALGQGGTRAAAVSGTPDRAANLNGWYNHALSVSWSGTDVLSGIASCSAASAYSGPDSGGASLTGSCTDLADNVGTASFVFQYDQTPPAIVFAGQSPAANAAGWNNTDVTLSWNCTDATSGPVAVNVSAALSSEGAGQSATGQCDDLAGNSASDTQTGINIDRTPPTITITTPPDGQTYLLNEAVVADYLCSDPGALSGIASCAGPVATGANFDTAAVGSHLFVVNAADQAGNSTSLTHAYSVGYNFGSFRAPIDPLPITNVARAGRTIPVKWQLTDSNGNFVSDLGSFVSLLSSPIACDASPTSIVEEQTETTGGTLLRYDSTAEQFIYSWQTSRSWTGCRLLQLTLGDGAQHFAKFEFR